MGKEFELIAPDLRAFSLRMKHMGEDVKPEFKKVHRKFARKIQLDIKNQMPKTGGIGGKGLRGRIKKAKHKEGPRHDTPRGAMSRSVKMRVTAFSSGVTGGGGPNTEHYVVNEFGGAVWWHRRGRGWARLGAGKSRSHRKGEDTYAARRKRFGGEGHIIPVRHRSPSVKGGGAEGWVFFPVFYDTMPKIESAYDRALADVIRRNVAKTKYKKKIF